MGLYLQENVTIQNVVVIGKEISSIGKIDQFIAFKLHGNCIIEKWLSSFFIDQHLLFFDRKNMLFAAGSLASSNNSPGLPWKYDLVRKKATASLNMDSRSNFDKIFCSNGRSEAKWSSSPFNRSRWRLEGLLLAWLLLSFVGVGLRLKSEKYYAYF